MRKFIILGIFSLVFLLGLFAYDLRRFFDDKLHVVFCNVGQGDGIFIRSPKGLDILVDGGPDDKVLSCLSNHMPFWDRTIELMVLTHPHADHFLGLISVLKRYSVLSFNTEELTNAKVSFKEFLKTVQKEPVTPHFLYARDRFTTKDGLAISVLGPTKEFLITTSPQGEISESSEFASLILLVSYGEFDLLLTGDSQILGLSEAITNQSLPSIEVFQVPHHGSRTGLDTEFLDKVRPRMAVISVGKNSYGHPSPDILKILRDREIKILRTDQDGEIEIETTGKAFVVK